MMLVCGVYGLLCNHILLELNTIHLYMVLVGIPQVYLCVALLKYSKNLL